MKVVEYKKIFNEYLKQYIDTTFNYKLSAPLKATTINKNVYFFTSHLLVKVPEEFCPFKISYNGYDSVAKVLDKQYYKESLLIPNSKCFMLDGTECYSFLDQNEEETYIDSKLVDKWFDINECQLYQEGKKHPVIISYNDEVIGMVMPIYIKKKEG